jgi:hypothetical protein
VLCGGGSLEVVRGWSLELWYEDEVRRAGWMLDVGGWRVGVWTET